VAGSLAADQPTRGDWSGLPRYAGQGATAGNISAAAAGGALLSSSQIQQVQQVQSLAQNLTNQWYQMLVSQGYNVNDPVVQAQVQAAVNRSLQQQGINVPLFQQWQSQMAA
jgi:hypothetical protein